MASEVGWPRKGEEGRGKGKGRRRFRKRTLNSWLHRHHTFFVSFSFLLSLLFELFFKPSAMRSRAAMLPLLAGLVLLCSATRAQVSVLFLPG